VRRYLDSLAARDWDQVRSTLASDVVRRGPYRDDYRGADDYARFLQHTIDALADYRLDIRAVWGSEEGVVAELAEEASVDGRRLRTDEAIVFRFDGTGQIAEVSVFLQRSYEP